MFLGDFEPNPACGHGKTGCIIGGDSEQIRIYGKGLIRNLLSGLAWSTKERIYRFWDLVIVSQ